MFLCSRLPSVDLKFALAQSTHSGPLNSRLSVGYLLNWLVSDFILTWLHHNQTVWLFLSSVNHRNCSTSVPLGWAELFTRILVQIGSILTSLTLSSLYTYFNTFKKKTLRKHCGKRWNCSSWAISPFSTMLSMQSVFYNPLTHSHTMTPFDTFGKEACWKHRGKRRNCLYKQFLLFPQCFLLCQRQKLPFL